MNLNIDRSENSQEQNVSVKSKNGGKSIAGTKTFGVGNWKINIFQNKSLVSEMAKLLNS